MVKPTISQEPQIFTINNIQDAFDLLSRGFEVYNQTANRNGISSAKGSAGAAADVKVTPTAAAHGDSSLPSHAGQKRRSYQPDLDIVESSDAIIVDVSLPGVDKSAINIEYDAKENHVVLSGEFKKATIGATTAEGTQQEGSGLKVIRQERPSGRYERVIVLGQQVILPDGISATYTDGVLTVTVPKNKEVEQRKKIAVQ